MTSNIINVNFREIHCKHRVVKGKNNRIIGDHNEIYSTVSELLCNNSLINSFNSRINGNHNIINCDNATLNGNDNVVNGNNSETRGNCNYIRGNNIRVYGNYNIIYSDDAHIFGFGNVLNDVPYASKEASKPNKQRANLADYCRQLFEYKGKMGYFKDGEVYYDDKLVLSGLPKRYALIRVMGNKIFINKREMEF